MSVIVTDAGFAVDDWPHGWAEAPEGAAGLHLPADADAEALRPHLARLGAIRIPFAAFSDGRGFTLAATLRRMGFAGRLRAQGHVIADQYAMARRAGFDEVEIDDGLAARQPEADWLARANWRAHDYRARLRGRAA
ncbi:DUF934 domain-containing protein [Pararhodobacter sp. SW119]|uniref:DUF934 domain-containing protein n=1 Tax=Pararhodobacter sp. SW119 TaxID=2780075 RepID=UPI001AE0A2DD|nr:DUF934 domain-containing protein [Pararhodobacter sp. SW119]